MQRFETKYDLLNAAYRDNELKKGCILLLQYLVHRSDKERCFPAVETIAKALNVCKRTVQYNMRKLEKAGYIIRKDRWYNHQQLTNQYVFNLGITEDVPGQIRYTDDEKEQIRQVSFHIPNDDIYMKNGMNQDENVPDKINKAAEIMKIYNMELSGREKLLLIYLIHRADKKCMAYDIPETFMKAIGVGNRTFMKLLKKLRNKNLIRVRYAIVSGKRLILIKLTGNIHKKEEREEAHETYGEEIQLFSQELSPDQYQELEKDMQTTQKRGEVQMLLKVWSNKIGSAIRSGLEKIRKILRL